MKSEHKYNCVIQTLRTANVLWRESRRFFRHFGITEAQFNVLNLLGQKPKGMSQRELSDLLIVDRSNVTLLLDRMERHSWIQRHAVPQDRRSYRVVLTKKGKTLWQRVYPNYRKAIRTLLSRFSKNQLRVAQAFLTRLEQQATHWQKARTS